MRVLFGIGLVLLVFGIASFFVSWPQRQSHSVRAGNVSIGVQTTESRRLPMPASIAIVVVGAALMVAGSVSRRTV